MGNHLNDYNINKKLLNKQHMEGKEKEIKQVADLYKAKYPNFPQRLYDAMYNYQVDITD